MQHRIKQSDLLHRASLLRFVFTRGPATFNTILTPTCSSQLLTRGAAAGFADVYSLRPGLSTTVAAEAQMQRNCGETYRTGEQRGSCRPPDMPHWSEGECRQVRREQQLDSKPVGRLGFTFGAELGEEDEVGDAGRRAENDLRWVGGPG
jgi:hypothetical protein